MLSFQDETDLLLLMTERETREVGGDCDDNFVFDFSRAFYVSDWQSGRFVNFNEKITKTTTLPYATRNQ